MLHRVLTNCLSNASNNSTSTKGIDVFFGDTKVGSVVPAFTGGWQVWKTVDMGNVEITDSEPILMTLKFAGNSFNLNWFNFSTITSASDVERLVTEDVHAIYKKMLHTIFITLPQNTGKYVARVVNTQGQTFYVSASNSSENIKINTSDWASGIYLVAVLGQKISHTFKLSVN